MNQTSTLIKVFYVNAVEILKNYYLLNDKKDDIYKFMSSANLYNWDEFNNANASGNPQSIGQLFIDSTQYASHQLGEMSFIMPDIGKFTINYSFEGDLVSLGKASAEFVTIGNQTGTKFVNPLFNTKLYIKLENLEGIMKFYLFSI